MSQKRCWTLTTFAKGSKVNSTLIQTKLFTFKENHLFISYYRQTINPSIFPEEKRISILREEVGTSKIRTSKIRTSKVFLGWSECRKSLCQKHDQKLLHQKERCKSKMTFDILIFLDAIGNIRTSKVLVHFLTKNTFDVLILHMASEKIRTSKIKKINYLWRITYVYQGLWGVR